MFLFNITSQCFTPTEKTTIEPTAFIIANPGAPQPSMGIQ
jgi:hypothetical protein